MRNLERDTNIDRRKFLGGAAGACAIALSAPAFVPASVMGKDGAVAPSNRVAMGFIGVGNQGGANLQSFLHKPETQAVAVCDVHTIIRDGWQKKIETHYAEQSGKGNFKGCKTYVDFRELLARQDIDAVMIAPPDQWHVPISIAACKSGKDVYLEKPMGLGLEQDWALRSAVRRYGTVFQFGTQQRSDARFRMAYELARNERIGKLHTINVWSPTSRAGGSLEVVPVPESLNYDMWLGPAPFTPYTKDRCANVNPFFKAPNKIWPFISDYCLGWIAGWGVHPLDIALWGGGKRLGGKIEVEGKGVFPTEGACDTAIGWKVALKYESGVTIDFRGEPAPEEWKQRYGKVTEHGTVFEGAEGWVHVYRGGIAAHPKSILDEPIGSNDVRLYKSKDHSQNFLDCVRSRAATICPIDDAIDVDTVCQLSNIATRLERKIIWDPALERFVDDKEASRFLSVAMRAPWTL